MNSLYQENILDHYQHPRNYGHLSKKDHAFHLENPSCGDMLDMEIRLKQGILEDIAFTGSGCAISQASASLLTEHVKGKSAKDILNMNAQDMFALLGITVGPARIKCALLGLETLHTLLRSSLLKDNH